MTSSTLNGYRSAIASVLTVIHPKEVDIAQLKEIKEFFKAKRRSEVIIKTPTQL
ncbi:hypothetical protein K501DRAFT_12070 [Backusella circina FSU 941]|nr:hypothetical protein K501DRAFT_12070 [Backusella circina FSU 941]